MKYIEKISLVREKISLYGIIFLIVFSIIIPLVLGDTHPIAHDLSFSIGIAVFSSLSIQQFFQKETVNLILEGIPLLNNLNEKGINKVLDDNRLISISDYKTSTNLYVVMNDGKNFMTHNSGEFCDRFNIPNISTTFILLDYDAEASRWLSIANNKKDPNFYKNKILDSINMIENYPSDPNHIIKVFLYSKGYFRTSIILSDKQAIIGNYRNAPGKRGLPLHFLVSKNGSYYRFVEEDVKGLIRLSKEITVSRST